MIKRMRQEFRSDGECRAGVEYEEGQATIAATAVNMKAATGEWLRSDGVIATWGNCNGQSTEEVALCRALVIIN